MEAAYQRHRLLRHGWSALKRRRQKEDFPSISSLGAFFGHISRNFRLSPKRILPASSHRCREPIARSPLAARRVKVENGSGSGDYPPGTQLLVSANDPPKDQKFERWVDDHQILLVPIAPTITATIPYQEVKITATFLDLPKYMLTVVNGLLL
jgi:Divergent InlB B-repeat domain